MDIFSVSDNTFNMAHKHIGVCRLIRMGRPQEFGVSMRLHLIPLYGIKIGFMITGKRRLSNGSSNPAPHV